MAVLDGLDKRVRRALKNLAELPPEERHRARIRVKRLRYAIEFFAGLFPDHKTRRLVSSLGRLQDRLGTLNDIAVAGRLLRDHAEAKGDPQRLWAAGQIAGWHAGRVGELLVSAEDGRRACTGSSGFGDPHSRRLNLSKGLQSCCAARHHLLLNRLPAGV